jgi:hypothetical protein
MSDYSKTTNFASKDALLSGNPSKVVNGTELNTEFDDISTAIATKIEGASPTFTGTVTTATLATTIDDANNAAVITPFTLTHTTSGTPGAGIGVGLDFVAETAASNNELGASIRAVTTDVGAGTEDFDLVVNLMKAGAAASEALRVSSTGVLTTTGSVVSDTDSTDSLGTTGVRWANAYVDDITVTADITVGGTVDGRDLATDGTKLDTVETSADVTDATNVNLAGAVMNTDTTTASMSFVIDEDAMGSDSATKVPTQQSTKAYVDAQLVSANGLAGALAIGASTDGTDIVVTAADKITTDTIAETTAASGVTIDSVLVKDNTVTATTFVGALTGTASGNLVSGGALSTPSSGTATNITGLPPAGVVGTAAILGANTFTGTQNFADNTLQRANLLDYSEVTNAIGSTGGGTQDIDLTLGNSVTATVDTSANTFTFSNPTATDELCGFTLYLTNGASQTVAWPASVDWPSATAPTLSASGLDILVFTTVDGGTIWHGQIASTLSS